MMFVSDAEVRRQVSFEVVLDAIERAFIALHEGRSQLFEVVRGQGGGEGHFFGIKAARDGSVPVLGLKVGSYVPDNHARGLPAHTSTTLLVDDLTGQAFAVVEANYLNGLRTSAANALATRALARPDAATLGIIGIGGQAVFEALAVAHVRPVRRILAVGTDPQRRAEFATALQGRVEAEVEFTDARSAASQADILVTATPARAPVIEASWVRPGTHISAMGADNVGKQELPVALVAAASLWVDDAAQASRIGEAQHVCGAGLRSVEALGERTLGRLLREGGGRQSREDITVFDSSGLAIQDLAAAQAALLCIRGTNR